MREEAGSIDRAIREEVRLAAYSEAWPAQFVAERDRLAALFPTQLLAIEHFGSTAIPGMPAKPIVDILAGVESMGVADSLFEPILACGYTTSREFNATLPDRRWFMRSADDRRTHHLHVVVLGSRQWEERLRFRDILRSHAGLAQQYAKLKSELASRHRSDREAYTDAKSEFVSSVVAVA
jgi:GrpB-like predicted nucleotidyltransferase (UPF0157 family)